MPALVMAYLGRMLAGHGFRPVRFGYSGRGACPAENAARLHGFIQGLGVDRVHLLAHSLGGIVVLHLFERFPRQPSGRVVLLGSPVLGSGLARRLASTPGLAWLLGRSRERGLLGDVPGWRGGRELGVIAGTRGPGVGTIMGGVIRPNDGTVALAETRLAGATDFLTLPVSHAGMLLSRRVAEACAGFLGQGRF
jgi:pimeloyl-ACP methyl ester carboxylesterase